MRRRSARLGWAVSVAVGATGAVAVGGTGVAVAVNAVAVGAVAEGAGGGGGVREGGNAGGVGEGESACWQAWSANALTPAAVKRRNCLREILVMGKVGRRAKLLLGKRMIPQAPARNESG